MQTIHLLKNRNGEKNDKRDPKIDVALPPLEL
jgi:hypothetical protein